ncbi:MAG: LamG-like jellyroll fold domain-containing protein [Planctomycetota bacterium]
MTTSALTAQIPQAIYPLLADLFDATSMYGPVTLTGNPTPPAPPANGVCVNGIYSLSPGGQDVRTPAIATLTTTDFQIEVEFSIAALPAFRAPVLMAGNGWRWIGIYVQANGTVGLKYNNSLFTWSTTTLTTGTWYAAVIKYDSGNVELFINGVLIHQATLGTLTDGNNKNFTTNDFSNGSSHNGCIRNLVISNDATLGLGAIASANSYGTGCDGLVMDANGDPSLGNLGFELEVSNVPAGPPLVFAAFGSAVVNPGIDLTVIGMAGCFSYTSFDLGLYGPAAVIGGIGTFPLPIPSTASLQGTVLAAQGVSFSATTTLGLASSNGLQLTIGL